jgi:hypothetical protein
LDLFFGRSQSPPPPSPNNNQLHVGSGRLFFIRNLGMLELRAAANGNSGNMAGLAGQLDLNKLEKVGQKERNELIWNGPFCCRILRLNIPAPFMAQT